MTKLVLVVAALGLGPPLLWSQYDSAARTEELYRLHYDRGIVATCGLESAAVQAGFDQARTAVERNFTLDAAELNMIRRDALAAADREWSNRGIGGFRAWCAGVGLEAAERLRAAQVSY